MKIETHADFLKVQKEFEAAGFPCSSLLAEELWNWSNDNSTCAALALSVMTALGYQAYTGYPLLRLREVKVQDVYFDLTRIGWVEHYHGQYMAFRCWGKWHPGQAMGMYSTADAAVSAIESKLKN